MNRFKFGSKVSALLLAVLMLMSIIPTAHAANDSKCATCGTACTQIVLKQATCHEQGVVEYICVNSKCAAYRQSVLVKTDIDATNHDTICFDNNDGATHTAHCRYHADYKNVKEAHLFVNGYCTKCAAADYSQASIVMASELEVYVDLNDNAADLSIGKVAITVGSIDVTKNYIISYSWVNNAGTIVGTDETYRLPAEITAQSGDHTFGCFVMAMPQNGTAGKYVTASCTVKVHVRDMISASAVVGSKDASFKLGDTNGATTVSVMQQIYQAVYQNSETYPAYVVFDKKPDSDAGDLVVGNGAYYFSSNVGQLKLSDVVFVPANAGSYTITFTAYDTKGNAFPGVLTIVVESDLGKLDVACYAEQNEIVPLSSASFAAYWQELYPGGLLNTVCFTTLPASTEGILFYNYNPYSAVHTPIKTTDLFFTILSSANQYLIDGVSFVPASKYTGHVTIPFDIYGLRADGMFAQESGTLSIFITSGEVADVTYSLKGGDRKAFAADDFLSVYRTATGNTTGNFSIKLIDAPQHGTLYLDYTGTIRDTALTELTINDYTFFFKSDLSCEISDLTYVAPKAENEVKDTIRYMLCDEKGEFVYIGEIVITTKKPETVYTKSFPDVKMTDWFYTYVMDLAEAGIINGFEETAGGVTTVSYKPQDNVTYAQALKLIMLAVGYEEQAPTGKHWASGYLTKAQEDSLVSTVLTEARLDEQISRNMIAQIAARAMKLPKSTRTESPLKDVSMNGIYTSYILSLYDAGIITGDDNGMYNGTNKITRAEMATIVWRVMNYED